MPKAALRSTTADSVTPSTRVRQAPAASHKPAPTIQAAALVPHILHGIREKKGLDIAVLSLGKLGNTACDYFIVCTGNTDRQTQAIADSVEEQVRLAIGERPWHIEGHQSGEWILLDYVNVVVHIFVPRARDYYGLEELWGDAETARYPH